MTKEEEILNRIAEKLLASIERSSGMAGQVQTRYGRGGSSNGSSPFGYKKGTLDSTSTEFARDSKNLKKASEAFTESIRRVTKMNYIFGKKLEEVTDDMVRKNRLRSSSSLRIIDETSKLAARMGVANSTLIQNAKVNLDYATAAKRLVELNRKQYEIDKTKLELAEEEKKFKSLNNRRDRAKHADELRKLTASIDAKKDLISQEQKVADEMRDLQPHLKKLSENLDDTSAAFTTLDPSIRKVIKDNNLLSKSHAEQDRIVRQLADNSKDFADTLIHLNRAGIEQNKLLRAKTDKVMDSLGTVVRGLGGVAGQAIVNYREQLKYNVGTSNYGSSLMMGMSDAEMSKFLGSNAETLRGITGKGNLNSFVDSGEMRNSFNSVLATYGETGAEGAQRIAQLAAIMQASGSSIRGQSGLINDRATGYGKMAERVGISKGELTDFIGGLAQGGELAFMAQKYSGMDAASAQKALDRELEARIANAKMLGMSTDQLKQQIQMERNNRYGNIGDQIRKIVAGKVMRQNMEKRGIGMSDAETRAQNNVLMGVATSEESLLAARARERYGQSMNTSLRTGAEAFGNTGNFSQFASAAVERSVIETISGGANQFGVSTGELEDQLTRQAKSRGIYGADRDAFLQTGQVSSLLTSGGVGQYDSGMIPAGLERFSSAALAVYEGFKKNPMASIATATAATAINTGIMILQMRAMGRMGMMPGGGMGGRAATAARTAVNSIGAGMTVGAGARTAGGMFSNAKIAGASRLLKGTGVLAGVGGALSGYADGASAGESTGNITSRAVGGATGGGLGAWGGAAAGAAIGTAVFPVVGTAIGAALGGILGGWGGSELGSWIGDGIYDAASGDQSPQSVLEKSRVEAEKQAAASPQTTKVEIVGSSADAINKMAGNTEKLAETGKQQLAAQQKTNEHYKSASDINDALAALHDNQMATIGKFQSMS